MDDFNTIGKEGSDPLIGRLIALGPAPVGAPQVLFRTENLENNQGEKRKYPKNKDFSSQICKMKEKYSQISL